MRSPPSAQRCSSRRRRTTPTLGANSVDLAIEQEWHNAVGTDITVDCPTGVPVETGWIFDCNVTPIIPDGTVFVFRVTEDDTHGHFHWQPTSQGTISGRPATGGST